MKRTRAKKHTLLGAAVAPTGAAPIEKNDFLDDGANSIRKTKNKISIVKKIPSDRIQNDVEDLNATELMLKYQAEYDSWKNMKQRVKKTGGIVAPEFQRFPSFLRKMGAIPYKGHTLDRIDNTNPDYTPDNCQWADKADQANNRSNTKFLTHNDEKLPAAAWARRMGVKLNTIHSRLARGWTESEAITGKRKKPAKGNSKLPSDFCWRGSTEEQFKLEKRYLGEPHSPKLSWKKRNRYVAYLDYIGEDTSETGMFLQEYDRGYYRDSDPVYIRQLRAELDAHRKLYCSVEKEYWQWQDSQPKRKPTADEQLLDFIRSAKRQERNTD